MGTVYDKLVDQAEAMVNIINKKYIAGNRMAYLALLFQQYWAYSTLVEMLRAMQYYRVSIPKCGSLPRQKVCCT